MNGKSSIPPAGAAAGTTARGPSGPRSISSLLTSRCAGCCQPGPASPNTPPPHRSLSRCRPTPAPTATSGLPNTPPRSLPPLRRPARSPRRSRSRERLTGSPRAPRGRLWFTENGTTPYIGKVAYQRNSASRSMPLPAGTNPEGITVGPDGNIWFVGYGTSVVGKITPGGSITTYSLSAGSRPVRITTGSDGNLWVTESVGDRIARITPGGAITEFAVPTASALPWGITAGPDGNLWFTENGSGKIGRITTSGVITEYSLGSCCGQRPFDIVADDSDGNLWFTESGTSDVGPDHDSGDDYPIRTADQQRQPLWHHRGRGRFALVDGGHRRQDRQAALARRRPIREHRPTRYPVQSVRVRKYRPAQRRPADFDLPRSQRTVRDLQWSGWLWRGLSAALQSNLSLTYNSDTVDVQPIIETTYQSDPNGPVPTQIQVHAHVERDDPAAGDLFHQRATARATSTCSAPRSPPRSRPPAPIPGRSRSRRRCRGATSSTARSAARRRWWSTDRPTRSARGWSVGGTAQLIPDGNGGYFWVDGNGGTRDFEAGNGTTFVSPPNDLGTLVKNSNGTFTYTDPASRTSGTSTARASSPASSSPTGRPRPSATTRRAI